MDKETLTVKETAQMLGMSEQGVRIGIQRKILPIGYALPSIRGNEIRYLIPKKMVFKYLGIEATEKEN